MSRRRHMAKPMTMSESICHLSKPYFISGKGLRVHGSHIELVGTIEETTCKLCAKAYWNPKLGDQPLVRPKKGDPSICVECWSDSWAHRPYCSRGPYPDGPPVDGADSADGFGDDIEDAEDEE